MPRLPYRSNILFQELFYKLFVLFLTYLTYLAYHIAKRPIAVVENSKYFLDCNSDPLNETTVDDVDEPECRWSWVDEMNGVDKVIILNNHQEFVMNNLFRIQRIV